MEAVAALGVASSCITFVDAGIKVFRVVAESLRSADGAIGWVRDLLEEVNNLTGILEQVRDSLFRYECTKATEARLESLLQNCEKQALLVKDTLDGLTVPSPHPGGSRIGGKARDVLRRTWKAGLTVVEEGKINKLKDGLGHLKDNLLLQLSAIGLDLGASQLEVARSIQDSVSPLQRDIKTLTSPIYGIDKTVGKVDYNVRQIERDIVEVRSGVGALKQGLPGVEAKVQILIDLASHTNDSMLALQNRYDLLNMEANTPVNRQLLLDTSVAAPKSDTLGYRTSFNNTVELSGQHQALDQTSNGHKTRVAKVNKQCPPSCTCQCHEYQRTVADHKVGNASRMISFISSLFIRCSVRTCRVRKTEWALQLPSSRIFSPSVTSQVIKLGFEASNTFGIRPSLFFHSVLDVNTSRTFQVISNIANDPCWTADSTIRQLQGIFDRGEGSPQDRYSTGDTLLSLAWSTILFTEGDDNPVDDIEAAELFKYLLHEGSELEYGPTCSEGFRNLGRLLCDVPDLTATSRRRSTQLMLEYEWEPPLHFVPAGSLETGVQASRLMNLYFLNFLTLCSNFCEDIIAMPTQIDSALASAVLRSDIPTARRLLNRGANINAITTFSKDTILHLGVTSSAAMFTYILSQRPLLNIINDEGYTPLLKATRLTLSSPAIALVEAGAIITIRRHETIFPGCKISHQSTKRREDCINFSRIIIEWFESVGRFSELKENLDELLTFAVKLGDVEKCRLYLDKGARLRLGAGGGEKCLDLAVVKLLRAYDSKDVGDEGDDGRAFGGGGGDDDDDDLFFDAPPTLV